MHMEQVQQRCRVFIRIQDVQIGVTYMGVISVD